MKIRIEVINDLPEDEVIIKCAGVDTSIQKIQQFILEQTKASSTMAFFKGNEEYFFPLDDILFFETNGDKVYAHTADDAYSIKYRLYELEEILPRQFVRISKSGILNIKHIYSIQRNLTASSLIRFRGSYQQVYVSRAYFKNLQQRLDERSQL